MTEYIDREAAIAKVDPDEYYHSNEVKDMLKDIPAADVMPVVHGRWRPFPSNGIGGTAQCSICEKSIYGYRTYHYCPNCGCKMQEDNDGAE